MGRGLLGLHGAFATAQIAISMVLLALAGLFAQSLANVARVDLGFDAGSLIGFGVSPPLTRYDSKGMTGLGDGIAAQLAALPGVSEVAISAWPRCAAGASDSQSPTRDSGPRPARISAPRRTL
jgi:hypothetical protein